MAAKVKVGIVGLGLIGGSIEKCLRGNPNYELLIVSNSQEQGLKADGERRMLADLSDTDIVFLCGPQSTIKKQLEEIAVLVLRSSKEGTVPESERAFAKSIITDVGSTKETICNLASEHGLTNFIGGHPMAGTEEAGYEASFAQLFGGCTWILMERSDRTKTLEEIISKDLAAETILEIDAASHDKCVAAISHIPLVLSIGLGNLVREYPQAKAMIGPGFSGMARLAKGNETLGREIINANRDNIKEVWELYKNNLDSFLDVSDASLIGEIGEIKEALL